MAAALLAPGCLFARHEEGPGCTNTCRYASDGDCDDGGEGSDYSLCELGTDCNDCRPRSDGSDPSPSGYLLTCNDARPGFEQCVHYTFDSAVDRDDFYGRCADLTSRAKDVHNCPGGETGGGFCRHTTGSRQADTFTYNSTPSELRDRCDDTEGVWMTR